MPESTLFTKLSVVADLSEEDRESLHQLCRDVRSARAKHDIVSSGQRPEQIHLMVQGWAARYKMLADGSRQITGFLLPGDFCD